MLKQLLTEILLFDGGVSILLGPRGSGEEGLLRRFFSDRRSQQQFLLEAAQQCLGARLYDKVSFSFDAFCCVSFPLFYLAQLNMELIFFLCWENRAMVFLVSVRNNSSLVSSKFLPLVLLFYCLFKAHPMIGMSCLCLLLIRKRKMPSFWVPTISSVHPDYSSPNSPRVLAKKKRASVLEPQTHEP